MNVDIVSYSDADLLVQQISPVDIGDDELHLHLRKSAADATVFLDATRTNGLIFVVASTDTEQINLRVPQNKLLKIEPGDYEHSLIKSSNGGANRVEVWRGTWTHNAGPTRWAAGTL